MNLVKTSLINIINNPKNNLVDSYIANYIIVNSEIIDDLSISELARNISVSVSQLSRFVRSIGFSSYQEFKEACTFHGSQERHTSLQKGELDYNEYKNKVLNEITFFHKNFDFNQLDNLVTDIHRYTKVAIFGILNSDNVAKELQYNLIKKGKICVSYVNYNDQLEYIKKADSKTLIIIFSLSGDYIINEGYSRFYHTYNAFQETKAKIWVITKNVLVKELNYVSNTIIVPVNKPFYNYTLQCVSDTILLAYQEYLLKC